VCQELKRLTGFRASDLTKARKLASPKLGRNLEWVKWLEAGYQRTTRREVEVQWMEMDGKRSWTLCLCLFEVAIVLELLI
jgi:hypothetical protein